MSARSALRERPLPDFALLCVMTHHVLDALGADAAASDVVDELKWLCARSGFAYPEATRFEAALDAVTKARGKGYVTPRTARRCDS